MTASNCGYHQKSKRPSSFYLFFVFYALCELHNFFNITMWCILLFTKPAIVFNFKMIFENVADFSATSDIGIILIEIRMIYNIYIAIFNGPFPSIYLIHVGRQFINWLLFPMRQCIFFIEWMVLRCIADVEREVQTKTTWYEST